MYQRVSAYARSLLEQSRPLEVKYGIPIVNKRIAITPVSLIMETHATPEKYLAMAQTLDRAALDAGIDFIGGFGALVQKGLTRSRRRADRGAARGAVPHRSGSARS